jgi:predicted nucleic acid-binding protein
LTRVFVDTSALIALVVANDDAHGSAVRVFSRLESQQSVLVTSSYALVETYALLGRRHGNRVIARFREELQPLFDVVWVDRELHERGLDRLLGREIRGLSLVDAVSFVIMEGERIEEAFAYDRHFEQAGFSLIA